jgi:methionyl-tRNA formyltransferase
LLRTIFIGAQNTFDDVLVDWLAERSELVGVIWIDAAGWRRSWKDRLAFTRKRMKRYGFLKTLDEIAFFLYYQGILVRRERRDLDDRLVASLRERYGNRGWSGDQVSVSDVNSPEAMTFLRERKPDVAFAMCVNNYFSGEMRALMNHGVFLWHEGVTPEYRGLYSPFWAVHNLDFERIGYTLLRMNDEYDAGDVYVQGRARDVDPRRDLHAYLGHKAIADSLPEVETFLRELEAGTAAPIERREARSGYYTYPGLSDFVRQRIRLRRSAAEAV